MSASLLEQIVSRIRKNQTLFGDRAVRSITMQVGNAYTKLKNPKCLAVLTNEATIVPSKAVRAGETYDEVIRVRSISIAGYFTPTEDLRSEKPSEVEQVTEELMRLFINWTPTSLFGVYGPGQYDSMYAVAGDQVDAVYVWKFNFPLNHSVSCFNEIDLDVDLQIISTNFNGLKSLTKPRM
jgi:hypothetical protein